MSGLTRLQNWTARSYAAEQKRREQREAWASSFMPDGWVAAWVREWESGGDSPIIEQAVEMETKLKDLIGNAPVLDVSCGVAPPVVMAMLRSDALIVWVEPDAAKADWLEATLKKLKVDNLIVLREPAREQRFEEVICRDMRPVAEILRRTRRQIALGGRQYLARIEDEGHEVGGALIQKIALGPQCLVLHYSGNWEEPGVAQVLETASLLLDKIEAEMKALGMWTAEPPPMPPIKSYLDAPSFELWLQCVFLPHAREAVALDEFPGDSQVSRMAQQQDMDASRLMEYLRAFDLVVVQRNQPDLKLSGMQAVSEGGRLLTKGKWREPAWHSVDATPYDVDYFPKAMASLAWGLGVEVRGEDPWEFVLDGARIAVRMNYRQSCSIAAETIEARDKIFAGLVRTRI